MTRGAAALGSIAALVFAGAAHADFVGRVVAVHDGDTISVLVDKRTHRVRLIGIDAPERGQSYAKVSRRGLEARVAGREVRVIERGRDGYGRVLGRVWVGNLDVNAAQIRDGFAWVPRRFDADAALVALEAEAKAARRGLWRDPRPLAPWLWREREALRVAAT